jgi:hypothetical protein
MKSLLGDYLRAVRATDEVVNLEWSATHLDHAIAAVLEAEDALRLHVKIAAGVHPSRTVEYPVAAYLDGALVVIAPSNDDHQIEHLHVIDPRDIVRGG